MNTYRIEESEEELTEEQKRELTEKWLTAEQKSSRHNICKRHRMLRLSCILTRLGLLYNEGLKGVSSEN